MRVLYGGCHFYISLRRTNLKKKDAFEMKMSVKLMFSFVVY